MTKKYGPLVQESQLHMELLLLQMGEPMCVYPSNGTVTVTLTLPFADNQMTNYLPLHFDYTFTEDGTGTVLANSTFGPITQGHLVPYDIEIDDNNTFPGWAYQIQVPLSVGELCNDYIYINLNAEIKTPFTGGFIPYPIHFYTDPGQLYSEEVFPANISPEFFQQELVCCFPYAQGPVALIGNTNSNNLSAAEKFEEILEAPKESDGFEIFPNPFDNVLKVNFINQHISGNLIITNSVGKQVHHQIINSLSMSPLLEIPAENWIPGIYLVSLISENGKFTKKLIKM